MTIARLAQYGEIVGQEVMEELHLLAARAAGRSIKMVNSTAVGGGVAEMMHRVVPLLNELEVRTSSTSRSPFTTRCRASRGISGTGSSTRTWHTTR